MILIPAIDLMGGKIVRLEQGRRDGAVECKDEPLDAMRRFRSEGAAFFHVTDLDAVFGTGDNRETLRKLNEDLIGLQVGGGIRDVEAAEALFADGADRVVLGTLFYEEPDAAADLVGRFGVRVVAAVDVEDGQVKTRGWEAESGHGLDEAKELLVQSGVRHVIYREIRREDLAPPPDFDAVAQLTDGDHFAVYAHVDVGSLDQLGDLDALSEKGLTGLVLSQSAKRE
jgi:phosphoribosylformimino-5-aminoimidazole carboxamide ribonucleotide (ProFAR) isomerase